MCGSAAVVLRLALIYRFRYTIEPPNNRTQDATILYE